MAATGVFSLEYLPLLSAVFVIIIALVKFTNRENGKDRPPIYKGALPWLGCAIEFGRSPLSFIHEKSKELGSVFSLRVAGERLTFLMEAEDFDKFFTSTYVDFQKAVQDTTNKVASLSQKSFFEFHTKIHDQVKGKLAASQLSKFSDELCQSFKENLQKYSQGEEDLLDLMRDTMYPAVIDNLFGKDLLPIKTKEEFDILKKHFTTYDDQFEYGAKLPGIFLRDWSKSKAWLLKTFHSVVDKLKPSHDSEGKETILQIVCGIADQDCMANYSMLFLWASLANAIPITFWTLAFMLKDQKILQKAKSQVDKVLKGRSNVTEADLREMPFLKFCILEAIRLRSPGVIARRVVKEFTVKGKTVPVGDLLLVSPFWAHRNVKYFPDPEKYSPERWEGADLEKNMFLPGFIAFGGGRYQCPGRWFALLEMHMFVALFLQRFDCKLMGNVPQPSCLHLVGTQQPETACSIKYSLRS